MAAIPPRGKAAVPSQILAQEILSTAKYAKYAKNPDPSPESFPVSRISRISRFPLFSILARFLNLYISRGLRGMLPSVGEDLGPCFDCCRVRGQTILLPNLQLTQ
jgi:hypothetical protein